MLKGTTDPRAEWLVPAGLIALTLVPALFGVVRLNEIAAGAEMTAANERFLTAPLPIVLHILVVIPYCIVGAFQFPAVFRKRHRAWHRAAGRVLAPLGLIAALTGLWMTLSYAWPPGDGVALYWTRLVVGSAMFVFIMLALFAVRRRNFSTHGAWMMRAYALGIGAGTQVLTHLPWFVLFGKPGEGPRAMLMGAAWAINLGVAEWIIRARSRSREIGIPHQRRASTALR